MRGTSDNSCKNRIDSSVWDICNEYLDKLPKTPSHYTLSSKMYFENRDLNMTQLFLEFTKYFEKTTKNKLILDYETFRRYLKNNYNLGFKHPRTDLCDLHFKFEQKGLENLSIEEKLLFEMHIKKVENYKSLKEKLLEKNDKRICFEFDYSQNRPLPKIPNSVVFYKRLLWFYIFHIHLHNMDSSFMYHFLEGEFLKNPNSVCSFIFQTIRALNENSLKNIKEFIFFSDATCSQNRCWTVSRFCLFIAIIFNVKVIQIFPVRGHSFNICDSNFSILARKIKTIEKIEVPDQYVNYLNEQKKFAVIKGKVHDFESFLKPFFAQTNIFKISKCVKIIYCSSGDVSMQESYNESNQNFINLLKCDISVIKKT